MSVAVSQQRDVITFAYGPHSIDSVNAAIAKCSASGATDCTLLAQANNSGPAVSPCIAVGNAPPNYPTRYVSSGGKSGADADARLTNMLADVSPTLVTARVTHCIGDRLD